jgi:hypothetical protein
MFDLPDEIFVSEAFLGGLGRAADPRSHRGYVASLRRLLSRPGLLVDLQRSDEFKTARRRWMPSPRLHTAPDLWPVPWRARPRWVWGPARRDLLRLEGDVFIDAASWLCVGQGATESLLQQWRPRVSDSAARARALQALGGGRAGRWVLRPAPRAVEEPTRALIASRPIPASPPLSAVASLSGVAAFTIATRSYLPRVRVWARTLADVQPSWQRLVLVLDEALPADADEPWLTVTPDQLALPGWADMTLRYDALELATALKPFVARWLFQRSAVDAVIYLDPDMRFMAPLRSVTEALAAGAPLVLTPHTLEPLDDGHEPSSHTVLRSGVHNLGFVALRRTDDVLRFLDWWAERLRTGALVDFAANLFTDQRWCDLAPSFVAGTLALRDPGLNVAYWNLPHRPLARGADGRWTAAGAPLCFFHFSGFDPARSGELSRHQTRPLVEQSPPLAELLALYADEVNAAGRPGEAEIRYAFDRIEGVRWSPTLRRLYRRLQPQAAATSHRQALDRMVAELSDTGSREGHEPRLPALLRHLHAIEPRLQHVFDLDLTADRRSFLAWFWSAGVVEHGLVDLARLASQPSATPHTSRQP